MTAKLYRKIAIIMLAAAVMCAPVSRGQENDGVLQSAEEGGSQETNPPETNPPETNPPETNPPETNPPETNPPETNPRKQIHRKRIRQRRTRRKQTYRKRIRRKRIRQRQPHRRILLTIIILQRFLRILQRRSSSRRLWMPVRRMDIRSASTEEPLL